MGQTFKDGQAAGLTGQEAARLLAQVGPNAIVQAKGPSDLRRFLANFVQLLALLLWAGAVLALVAGLPQLSAAIVVVIVVNAAFSYVQEHRAEQAVAALRKMLPLSARVRRDGEAVEVPNEDVVPGDVLLLAPGDRVAADADLIVAREVRVDESTLTGESSPVAPDQQVLAGTYVTAGTAEACVTKTGMETRFGRIAELAQQTRPERSPLERELDHLTRLVAVLAVTIGVVFFVVAGFAGMDLEDRFVFAIGVTVALVPEGLLPTVTLSLALATQRMARRSALVRRLSSVETLGETTVICTDKTGTLTQNQMTAQRVWTPVHEVLIEGVGYEPFGRFRRNGSVVDPAPLAELLRAGLLCNDTRLDHGQNGRSVVGDPTEAALVVLAEKGGLRHEQEAARAPRLSELPFSSERKRMTTVHLVGGDHIAYVKGAAEVILPRTTLTEQARSDATAAEAAMERDALRVLALARRVLPADASDADAIEQELEFLGLVGMIDPPRPEIPDAVNRCRAAGIRIIMVTGDSGRTAEAIAHRIGLIDGDAHVITGAELAALDDGELGRRLAERQVIFARIDPEQKLRLAQLLRARGEVVAMTGDGVNDAPALKHADIGVAMGLSGTEVAKEAADLILIDDNFASVVAAVEEGRAVYDDIRRFAGYHFCSNIGELVPFLVWGISGGAVPLPLVVMQVLAIRPRHRPATGDRAGHRTRRARDDDPAAAIALRAPAQPRGRRPHICGNWAARGPRCDGQLPVCLLARGVAAVGAARRQRRAVPRSHDDDYGGHRDGTGRRRPGVADQPVLAAHGRAVLKPAADGRNRARGRDDRPARLHPRAAGDLPHQRPQRVGVGVPARLAATGARRRGGAKGIHAAVGSTGRPGPAHASLARRA